MLSLARTHERVGLFAVAARYYRMFGTQFTKSKHNYRALTTAMRYYFYQGMLNEALQTADYIRKKFTVNLPQDFYTTLAAVHVKAGNHDDAWDIYQYLLDNPRLTAVNFDLAFFSTLYDKGMMIACVMLLRSYRCMLKTAHFVVLLLRCVLSCC